MKVPAGFKVELVAAEPDLVNPVAMTFDERGRIWVAESVEYPRSSPGAGRDRIKILEDVDGDGAIDKTTIFAEGLNIPSGIALGYGGVWVANAPDILYLQDTNHDDRADRREVVVTGFGRTDTHELPNSLTWGPDGWLYGLNGVFNQSHVTYRGREYDFTCAMFRIHPRTRDFELFAQGTSNPWGIAWDAEGSAFVSACVIDHLWHLVETGYYHRQGGPYPPHTWKIDSIVKHKHQKAAYCGLHFFDSDAYPSEYRGKLYMGNLHGNCINVDSLRRDGSTYSAAAEPDFLSANDAWFMPVAQKTGPDGCLYVLDWYDQYHCYQDARRDPAGIDRAKGRLYRVRYHDSPRAGRFNLALEADEQLLARLAGPNIFFREMSQRLLQERNLTETRARLHELVFDGGAARTTRMHALWSLVGGGPLEVEFHEKLLKHADPAFRAWGVRAAGNQASHAPAIRNRVLALVHDPTPDVKLQAIVAAPKLEGLASLPVLLEALENCGSDRLIPHIVWQNLHPMLEDRCEQFLNILREKDLQKSPQLATILPRAIERILDRRNADPTPVAMLFELLADGPNANPVGANQCLELLAARVQSGELKDQPLRALQTQLQPRLSPLVAGNAAHPLHFSATLLAASWKNPAGLAAARAIFAATGPPPERRLAALRGLAAGQDEALYDAAGAVLADRTGSVDFRGRVLAALGALDSPRVAEIVLAQYNTLELDLQPRAIELLTQRPDWSRQLLKAISTRQVAAAALNANQVRKLLATRDVELRQLVAAEWGIVREQRSPGREAVIAEVRRLIRQTPGDALRGQVVYKKVCGQCHKIYGAGEEVGPDLTSNGRASFEQLLSNVFDPNLVIGAAYQARTVVTNSGKVFSGLIAEETDRRIVLKVQGGKLETIPRDEIEEMTRSELSLMPEGLEKQFSRQETADLFAFLTLDRAPGDPAARQMPGVHDIVPRETTDPARFNDLVAEVAPGFAVAAAGEGGVGLLAEHFGRRGVLRTHPLQPGQPCTLQRTLTVPAGKKTKLSAAVAHDRRGDWQLIVKANGQKLYDQVIGAATTKQGWADVELDLTPLAGREVTLELQNFPNNWSFEFGYWGRVEVITE